MPLFILLILNTYFYIYFFAAANSGEIRQWGAKGQHKKARLGFTPNLAVFLLQQTDCCYLLLLGVNYSGFRFRCPVTIHAHGFVSPPASKDTDQTVVTFVTGIFIQRICRSTHW